MITHDTLGSENQYEIISADIMPGTLVRLDLEKSTQPVFYQVGTYEDSQAEEQKLIFVCTVPLYDAEDDYAPTIIMPGQYLDRCMSDTIFVDWKDFIEKFENTIEAEYGEKVKVEPLDSSDPSSSQKIC